MTNFSASNCNKICFIKTGWSEFYKGGPVYGDYTYVDRTKDAYERFNFLPGPDGRFYSYEPPHNKGRTIPDGPDGWLVIVVSKRRDENGRDLGGVQPVGWLENATFSEAKPRPEYVVDENFVLSNEGEKYSYDVVSERAFLIPENSRDFRSSENPNLNLGSKLGSAHRSIVINQNEKFVNQPWKAKFAKYAIELVEHFRS